MRRSRWLRRGLPLLLLGLLALVAEAASVPHLHLGAEPGYYNREHDLGTLATTRGAAPPPSLAALAPATETVVVAVTGLVPAPPSRPLRHPDLRAPPVR